MKKSLFLLMLLPTIIFGQLQDNSFWKGYGVEDASGKIQNDKVQQFAIVKKNKLYLLRFFERINMETGEMKLSSKIDTLQIKKSSDGIDLILKDKTLSVSFYSSNQKFKIKVGDYFLPFKKTEQSLSIDQQLFKNTLVNNTYYKADSKTATISDKLLFTASKDGTINYAKEYSSSTWTSDYIIVNFYGNLFLKGVTSAPLLVSKIKSNSITFIELDYRYDPKLVIWKVYNKNDTNTTTPTNTNFELSNTTNHLKCINALSEAELNTEVLTYSDTNFSTPITEVQHAYNGKWTLFSDAKTRTFKKYTFRHLLKKDASLCSIIKLPNGYYANRANTSVDWTSYLHEERIKTDSSLITKKAFKHDNTYRVFNKLKNKQITYFVQYNLDTKIIREKGLYINGKEAGTWLFYDENGVLIKTEEK